MNIAKKLMEKIALARRKSSEKASAAEKIAKAKKWNKAVAKIDAVSFRRDRERASLANDVVKSGKIPTSWPGPLKEDAKRALQRGTTTQHKKIANIEIRKAMKRRGL